MGRFFSVDPLAKKFAYNSPYAFSENRINDGIELEGLEVLLLGFGGGGNVVVGGSGEAGIAFGPDGVYKYGSIGGSLATNISGGGYLTITYYGNMPSVQDASGAGYSIGWSAGEGPTAGVNAVGSSGYLGLNYQIGWSAGALFAQGQGGVSKTWLSEKITTKSEIQPYIDKAQLFIKNKIGLNNESVISLKTRNDNLLKENKKLNSKLENGSEMLEMIDSQIDKNNAEYYKNNETIQNLQTETKQLGDLSKMIDEYK